MKSFKNEIQYLQKISDAFNFAQNSVQKLNCPKFLGV